ncbi:MAG TPA: methionine sulfoxide reductase [Porphyromonadaceae bacterium]|jgi:peptide methionine sulfoxide reductase msrA/msrB|nr:methionine sulfoxide reductase [Porphyromonadaceae bacterium]HBU46360.1 methionine sulfoxide reductase [Porphyromonadaceae bacterium]
MLAAMFFTMCAQENKKVTTIKQQTGMIYNVLTPEEERIIIHKGTERPFTGEYLNNKEAGTYLCKRCNAPLYRSEDKFESHCGWPSFDDEIEGAVKRVRDADGRRTEIICNNCGAHLGHVFTGEGFTSKQTRHCVNSISMKFVPAKEETLRTAYFASGCFWGTEYFFMKAPGVKQTTVGFMGGHVNNPTYEQVCQKNTGHLETTEVVFNLAATSYEEMVKLFFETHDFTQTNGQGPDIGPQYLSCIFYSDETEKAIAEKYISLLIEKGYKVATMLKPSSAFWKAENYHQQYYEHKGTKPYCHNYTKIF